MPVTGRGGPQVLPVRYEHHLHIQIKATPVTGRGGQQGYEVLRIPHCLGNRLTDGGEIVGLTYRPPSTP
jgi:hypothetical protein